MSQAVDGAWHDMGAGNWSDSARWVGGVAASGTGATAWFTNATPATINQDVPGLTLGRLVFANAPYTINNQALTLNHGAAQARIAVGAGHIASEAVIAAPLTGANGFVKTGSGHLFLTAPVPGALTGLATLRGGNLTLTAANGAPLGTGSLSLEAGGLNFSPSGASGGSVLNVAAGASDGAVAYGPGLGLLFFSRGAHDRVTIALGPATAAANSVLTRHAGGALVIAPNNGVGAANLGALERLVVNGGVPVNNGMASATIIGRNADSQPGGEFLTYGAHGFEAATYVDGVAGGPASIANVAANAAVGSASVYALRVNNGATLTISDGATLTVGDGVRPAGVILNSAPARSGVIAGGALDFGASEGVIHIGEIHDGQTPARLTSRLSGSGGVTFSSVSPRTDLELGAANTYSGGTRILGGRVRITAANQIPPGLVTVHGHDGWGGQLWVNGRMTLSNPLRLAGLCGYFEGFSFGAIRLEADGSVLSGPIELLDDARISVWGDSKTVTLSGAISGAGAFEANSPNLGYPYGTLLLTGANTYSGGTRVNRGELRLGTGGTLGSGPVRNQATLTFASATPLTVANPIAGSGALVQAGPGPLILNGVSNYAGPLNLNATLDLDGRAIGFGALSGTGRVVNAAGSAATLTVGSANTSTLFTGQIAGNVNLIKTGNGTLTLFGASAYSGKTTITSGTLALGSGLYADGLAYRLDASDAARITLDGNRVAAWTASEGVGVFSQATPSLQPTYVANAISGLPAVRFGPAGARTRLAGSQATAAQSVFIVTRKLAFVSLGGIWGQNGEDFGIRAIEPTLWRHPGNEGDFSSGGQMFINGAPGSSFTAGAPHLMTVIRDAPHTATHAFGDYWNNPAHPRFYIGDIGEALVYNRALGPVERQHVERYLMRKWLGLGEQPSNLLPTTTDLTVAAGGTLDLNGANQAVASLAGAGIVRNSHADPVTLAVGSAADSTFTGALEGAITLVKRGGATLTLFGSNTHSGGTVVEAGVLKLGKWSPPTGLSYRLDASDAARITLNGNRVAAWAASEGASVFSQATPSLQPTYVANAINGLPVVRFGPDGARTRLAGSQATAAQSVFIVTRKQSFVSLAGIWGENGADFGIRAIEPTLWRHPGNANDFSYNGQMFINGVPGSSFTAGAPHLMTVIRDAPHTATHAFGDYWNNPAHPRFYIGDIGEALVYNRALSDEERQSIETYLMGKWLGANVEHRLPTHSAVTVAAGAALDLNGNTQTLASLSGGGAIVGGAIVVTGQTAPGDANTVGALTFAQTPQLAGALLLDVRADGASDALAVTGDLDVSQLALTIVNPAQLGSTVYVIATTTGALTGTFTGHNLPGKAWKLHYDRAPGAGRILLTPVRGTVTLIK